MWYLIITNVILLLISIFFLVKSSDYLVSSSSNLAKHFGVKQITIGLTIVAFGTSIPELASAIASAIAKNPQIAIGNVAGSNISNLGFILGIACLMTVISIKEDVMKRDVYFLVGISFLFYLFILNGILSRIEGFILLLTSFFYLFNLFRKKTSIESEVKSYARIEEKKTVNSSISKIKNILTHVITKEFYYIIISIIVLAISARFVVHFIQNLATETNITEGVIAVSLLSLGTTLPELTVTIISVKKNLNDILVGNLIGSNISNILVVAAIPSLISPIKISARFITFIIPAMLIFVLLLLVIFKLFKNVRYAGVSFLLLYLLFIILLFF